MELKLLASKIRADIVKAIYNVGGGGGHEGGCMSSADLLAALYGKLMNVNPSEPDMEGRDRLIVSKGHIGIALYSALAEAGFIDTEEMIATINKDGTHFPSHCNTKVAGVDFSTGSLGQGFSVACGVALGSKLKKDGATIYTLVGDGECQEGQIWEGALFAAHNHLDNLIAFIDDNGAQIDGETKDVCNVGDLHKKFVEFGWETVSVDGHDPDAIVEVVESLKSSTSSLPKAVILKTEKGHGVSISAGKKHKCHHMVINEEMLNIALKELGENE